LLSGPTGGQSAGPWSAIIIYCYSYRSR